MQCKTAIPKTQFLRPEFFDSFHFIIEKETDVAYILSFNQEKLYNNCKLESYIQDFCVYLNYTLNSGDYVPFVITDTDEKSGNPIQTIRVFTKYPSPSPIFYYGIYTLTPKNWEEKIKGYNVFKDDYDTIMERIKTYNL
jgi:hypothetical protein